MFHLLSTHTWAFDPARPCSLPWLTPIFPPWGVQAARPEAPSALHHPDSVLDQCYLLSKDKGLLDVWVPEPTETPPDPHRSHSLVNKNTE